jgi:hypothetical protein
MDTVIQEHDKEKWLVFGNLEIRITPKFERDFRALRGVLKSKKSAVSIVRGMREDDRRQEARQ